MEAQRHYGVVSKKTTPVFLSMFQAILELCRHISLADTFLQLWHKIPVKSTNKNPFLECIIPSKQPVITIINHY